MSGSQAVGTEYSLVEVACPICGSAGGEPLVPSAKRDEVGETFFVDWQIMLALCPHCGTIYENPQIKLEGLTPYAERNYYTEANTAWGHDGIQHVYTFYNWHALKDALPWERFRRVMDVGAAGAWSNAMLERGPNVEESVLVEPSPRGIFNCEIRYPRVRAELGIFEEYEDEPGSFDLITFFSSFYSISNPREAFRKIHRLLGPGGYVVLCFSYVGMGMEFWVKGEPYVHMSHVVRGVPLIYYSRNTYEKLLSISGFKVVDDIVFELPLEDPYGLGGRQINFVVAQSVGEPVDEIDHAALRDPEEVDRARHLYTKYCEIATEKSIRLYLDRNGPGDWVVVHDGDATYGKWVQQRIAEAGGTAVLVDGKSAPVERLADRVGDDAGLTVFLAGDWSDSKDSVKAAFQRARVIDATPSDGYKGYGNWIRMPDGKIVITRAFCPSHTMGDRIFPFERRQSMNSMHMTLRDLGVVERPRFSLPRSVDDVPFFAGQVARVALMLPLAERDALLRPFHERAVRGPTKDSIAVIAMVALDVRLPADPVIPAFATVLDAKRISGIRPMIQWAALMSSVEELQQSIGDFSAFCERMSRAAPGSGL